ncbi:MAG: hypothetical protein A2W33_10745 [Chloroflexi bacterium RBG_16_52_11]|nr:MAG: hypothetical protein A2W33_10745 [Chloroflexi bacterium RBG_16_52_11]
MHYIPILSTVVTLIFAVAVFNRYRQKKGTHLLLWGIGLVFYGLGTLTEVILSFTFSELALKIWYLTGAMLTAAWLGQGTVHLLVRKPKVATTLTAILAVVSLIAAALVFAAPLTEQAAAFNTSEPVSAQYGEILVRSGVIVALTIILNIYGTITLVGGAIYSAWLFWRKKVLLNRVIGNVLIAAGALMPAMGGTLLKAGLADWLYVSELLGAVIMYAGFMLATSVPVKETSPAASAAD